MAVASSSRADLHFMNLLRSQILATQQHALGREGVHLRGEEAAAQKGRGKPKDLSKKAVLMSGPPGIGKTTLAMIMTRYGSPDSAFSPPALRTSMPARCGRLIASAIIITRCSTLWRILAGCVWGGGTVWWLTCWYHARLASTLILIVLPRCFA